MLYWRVLLWRKMDDLLYCGKSITRKVIEIYCLNLTISSPTQSLLLCCAMCNFLQHSCEYQEPQKFIKYVFLKIWHKQFVLTHVHNCYVLNRPISLWFYDAHSKCLVNLRPICWNILYCPCKTSIFYNVAEKCLVL